MDLLTTAQVAKEWGISQRRVDILCKEGRVEGAIMMGNRWFIPNDSPKPKDKRRAKNITDCGGNPHGKKTKEQISYNMKRVKNKDSDIELILRKELWSRGLRYRKNVTGIIGKPDIVFKSKKVAVFCDSEFWHGYDWDNRKGDFKSNKEFWIPKIERNMERDKEVNKALEDEGWKVLRFWGRDIKKHCKECADVIQKALEETND